MESESSLISEGKILNKKQVYSVKMFLDEAAKINVISQKFAVFLNFSFIESKLFSLQFMNGKKVYCYEVYEIKLILEDFWQRKRIFFNVYYAIDKTEFDLILEFSDFKQMKIIIDYDDCSWRYDFQSNVFDISKLKRFAKAIKSRQSIYAIMAQFIFRFIDRSIINVGAVVNEASTIFIKFAEFKHVFSKKTADQLITYKNCDHVIELKKNEFFYDFLYNFFNAEFVILKQYLNNALTKK